MVDSSKLCYRLVTNVPQKLLNHLAYINLIFEGTTVEGL